jgi:fibronectin-binding autotransporter adhesin
MMSHPIRRLLGCTFLALFAARLVYGDDGTWTGAGSDNLWSNTANWTLSGANVPDTGNIATFDNAGNSNTSVSLGGGTRNINTIQFQTANAAAYNLGVTANDKFNFDSNGKITVDSAVAQLETISAGIVANGDLNISAANSSAPASNLGIRLAGGISMATTGFVNITGSGAITVDAPINDGAGQGFMSLDLKNGALNLNALSNFSGGTTIIENTTGGQQPALRVSVDTVGAPGSVTSGPLGTGLIKPQSTNPYVWQAIGGDRTIANDFQFDRGMFVGSLATAPLPTGETYHSLTLTGTKTLPTGRVFTNNLPNTATWNFGTSTVNSTLSINGTGAMTIQSQIAVTGNAGSLTVINDKVTGSGTGANSALTVQNSARVVLNNANNDYGGNTIITTSVNQAGMSGIANAALIVNGAKTGAGTVDIRTRCNANLACSNAAATGISGVGILGGTGSVAGAVTNGGTIAPGAVDGTPGTLTLTGNLTDASIASPVAAPSHWAIELSGTAADKIAVGGNISLTAVDNLDISGVGTGGSWVIATYVGTLTGTFDVVTPGYYVDYGTGTNSKITLSRAGDWNKDGVVNAGDYVTWRKNPAANGGDPAGYNLWRANFGTNQPGAGAGGGLTSTGVPEPGTLLLLAGAIGIVVSAPNRLVRRRS